MKRNRPPLLCLAAISAAILVGVAHDKQVRLNLSGSMPVGFWRIEPMEQAPERGQVVSVCLPVSEARFAIARGYIGRGECPSDAAPLIKPVIAVDGDDVSVSPFGIEVNGRMIEGTALRPADSAGRPLGPEAPGTRRVSGGEVWLASTHDPRSFDSRYFGPVPVANVRGLAVPLLVSR